ncbi:sce7726 family protein [uncultured Desulfuromusa sp.]|uniref:sce7726 family protein n=1 Tax=uncultured Desulfuromusa sp. TaxID=219183 RepID=UPI002AA77736|nr:sce7726 family protein [uncultured Desulfuromusa sp.]
MEEHEIRSSLLSYLAVNAPDRSKVQEEFRIECGRSRIDVAVIDSTLIGYEIKSEKDTFVRFSNQIHAYNRVFDQINLVCSASHARLAEEVVPSWWGLIVAERGKDGDIQLVTAREARTNTQQEPFSLASLLCKDEAIAVLTAKAQEIPKKASSHTLREYIVKALPIEQIKSVVTKSLLCRQPYNNLEVKTM